MPKVPQKPPQFFIELDKGKVINPDNKDINPILNQISVKSLINWKKDTNIELIMDEIYDSFLKIYPICKTTLNPCSKGKLSQIKSVYI